MDEKKYSLNDIFGFLREATMIFTKPVAAIHEDENGKRNDTPMILSEYIAMSLAKELISDDSRMASEDTTAKKEDVIAAMKANYYDEVAYPKYEHFGIRMGMDGGKRSSSRSISSSSRSTSKKTRKSRKSIF
jgi:hypothetical protein